MQEVLKKDIQRTRRGFWVSVRKRTEWEVMQEGAEAL